MSLFKGVPSGIWIASREAGWARLYYVTFKSGLARRHLPRELGRSVGYETVCSRKVRLSCSGLECCATTEAVQHSLQRCKTLSPKKCVGLHDLKAQKECLVAKPLAFTGVLGCKILSPKLRVLGCKTQSPKRRVWLQNRTPQEECWVAKP